MQRAILVCLVAVSGCSSPRLDITSQSAAIKPAPSCEHIACKPHHDDNDPKRAACCVHASVSIGEAGGTVTTGDGTSVEIPLGAVDHDVTITIQQSGTPAPKVAASPIIQFGPDGIVFAHPVKVTIPLARTTGKLTTFWTSHDGAHEFDPIGGTVVGDNMVVEATHFSSAYVADDPGYRKINGISALTWVGNPTQIVFPDLSAAGVVEALVPDGSGGYTPYEGSSTAPGMFTIDNVPVGPALVRAGNKYTMLDITADTDVDLSRSTLGDPNAIVASDASELVFNATLTTAWQDGDSMEFFCPQNNDWMFGMETFGLANFPAPGDTVIQNMVLPDPLFLQGGGALGNLIEARRDTCSLLHMQSRTTQPVGIDPAVTYLATIESYNPTPFDQLDGQDTFVPAGTFTSRQTPNSISVDLQMQLYAQALGPGPAGTVRNLPGASFYISGLWEDAAGQTAPSASADFLGLDVTANPVDTIAHDMNYGLVLAGNWSPFGSAAYGFNRAFPVAGTPRAAVLTQQIFSVVDVSNPPPPNQPPMVIAPRLGPPDHSQIAGLDMLQPQTGVGLTPTVTWNPPLLGTPNLYLVTVRQLTVTANRRNFVNLATIATTGTSITLPPNILSTGNSYVFDIQAGIAQPNLKTPTPPPTTAPFNANVTDGANVLSSIIQP